MFENEILLRLFVVATLLCHGFATEHGISDAMSGEKRQQLRAKE